MPRRLRPPLAAGALALVALAAVAPFALESAEPPAASLPARPDVVLVTIDTLRADTVGFMGNREVETPNLDALAAAGRVFTGAHAHNVVTLPSHTNILTGLYPFQHRVRDNSGFVLGADVPTLATLLSQAGYATGAFVGAFPLDRRFGLARGFDVYDDHYPRSADPASFVIPERRGDEVVRAALAWWREAGTKPRFLWLHLYDPHAAYEPPEPFASRYRAHPYLGEIAAVDSFLAPCSGRSSPVASARRWSSSPATTARRSASTARRPTDCSPTKRRCTCRWWSGAAASLRVATGARRGTSTSRRRSSIVSGSPPRVAFPADRCWRRRSR